MPHRNTRGTSGRPPLSDSKRRKAWFVFRCSDEERDVIKQHAKQRRMPVAVYVRKGAYRGWVRQIGVGVELIGIAAEMHERAHQLRARCDDPLLQETAEFLERGAKKLRDQIAHL